MTVTEGGGRRAIRQKFEDVYLPALKANFLVWPMVQMLNFRVMPRPYQIVSPIAASSFSRSANLADAYLLSPSCQRLVSSGLHICPLQTHPMSQLEALGLLRRLMEAKEVNIWRASGYCIVLVARVKTDFPSSGGWTLAHLGFSDGALRR